MDCFDGRAWKARTRETCRYFQRTVEGVRKRHFRLSAPDAKVENFMRNQCAHLLSGGFLRVWGCVKARLLRVRSMGMAQRRLNNLLLSGGLSDCQHLGWTVTAFFRGWMGKWLPACVRHAVAARRCPVGLLRGEQGGYFLQPTVHRLCADCLAATAEMKQLGVAVLLIFPGDPHRSHRFAGRSTPGPCNPCGGNADLCV